jgi:hypothetical protein
MKAKSPALVSLPDTMIEVLHENEESNSQCLEKRVYYKIISGMLNLLRPFSHSQTPQVCMRLYRLTFAMNS